MGNGKNGYTLSKPKSPASKGRTYAIYCACGVDVRETSLTNEQAHKLLDAANNGQAYAVRAAVAELDGAVVKRKSVAKELQGDSKPKGYKDPYVAPKAPKKAKAEDKPEPEETTLEDTLLVLCGGDKAKAKAMALILAGETEKPKPKAKAKAKIVKKKVLKKPAPVKDEGGNGKSENVNLGDILKEAFLDENKNVAPL